MLAVIAPGQGSQTPGMLKSWIEDAESKSLLSSWSDAIGLDLLALGTTADADEIKDTANAQPLIVAAGLLSARALVIENYSVTSGHSVGELTVAALSGAISHEDALLLVRARGLEMAKAAAQQPSGMAAVLGGERSDVISALGALGLIAANENGGGQIVAAGDLSSLAELGENPQQGRALEHSLLQVLFIPLIWQVRCNHCEHSLRQLLPMLRGFRSYLIKMVK